MRRVAWPLLIAVILFFAMRELARREASTPAPSESTLASPSVPLPQTPRISERPALHPAPPPATRAKAVAAGGARGAGGEGDARYASFERVGDYAVAQNDLLLGALEPDAPDEGRALWPPSKIWPGREIPFALQCRNPERVEEAIRYLNAKTVMHFVPYNGQKDAVVFTDLDEDRCLSYVGRQGGTQPILLGASCGVSEVLHEVMHALGFLHEQSRLDRDEFVEILWPNIQNARQDQFAKIPGPLLPLYNQTVADTPFDHHSAMLYSPRIFSKAPDLDTMRSRDDRRIEPHPRLSPGDIARLAQVYGDFGAP